MNLKHSNNKNSSQGQAMIAVLCIMAVILAVIFSMLLASYQMYSSIQDQPKNEKWYQQAFTFSNYIKNQLAGSTAPDTDFEKAVTKFMSSNKDQSLSFSSKAPEDSSYAELKLDLSKSKKNLSADSAAKANGWKEPYDYYLTIAVTALNESKSKAAVKTKYEVLYAPGDYTYSAVDGNQSTAAITVNADYSVTYRNQTHTQEDLYKTSGVISDTASGTTITVSRAVNNSEKTYIFKSIGYVE